MTNRAAERSRSTGESGSKGQVLTRRRLVRQFTLASLGATAAPWLTGCSVNPATGERQFLLMSRADEIELDRRQSPHQISADYGTVRSDAIGAYLRTLGEGVAAASDRPDMPYRFNAVNANYINAYAFPGGTIGVSRGILLAMDNEAELAALLGHEVAHVTARHSAQGMTRTVLTQAAVGTLASSAAETRLGGVLGTVGQLGSGALLARYSRDNEQSADTLGMNYMAAAGHNPSGMVGLAEMLARMDRDDRGLAEAMFASHPTGGARLEQARLHLRSFGERARNRPLNRERFRDMMAPLYRLKPAINAMQRAERLLGAQRYEEARQALQQALSTAPEDYTALMLMGKLALATEAPQEAVRWFSDARAVYPTEPQALQFRGLAYLSGDSFGRARDDLEAYEQQLPGNPGTDFLLGYCYDNLGDAAVAVARYQAFLRQVNDGPQADYARSRLAAMAAPER